MRNRTHTSPKRKLKGFFHLIGSFLRKMHADRINVYSAQAAYYLLMSVIPMLMIMLSILQFTPLTQEMIDEALSQLLAPEAFSTVQGIVANVYNGSFTLVSFVALSMIWVAGQGVMGLANGLNSIYRLRENRNFFLLRLRASLYMLLLVAAVILALGVLVLGMRFQNFLKTVFPILESHDLITTILIVALVLIVMTLIFNALYVFLPNRKRKFRSQSYGAVFTTISWLVFSYFFNVYLRYAKNLSIIYGGLLTVMVAMIWLYWCLYLFFFGAEINAWKENPDILPY